MLEVRDDEETVDPERDDSYTFAAIRKVSYFSGL